MAKGAVPGKLIAFDRNVASAENCRSNSWLDSLGNILLIRMFFSFDSFSKMLLQKESIEQKHLHLVQIVESEKTAKYTYTQQVEDLSIEVSFLYLIIYTGISE